MKKLQFIPYYDGAGRGKVGLKSLNPSLPRPWCRAKISPYSHLTAFVGQGKTVWDEAGRGKIAISNCRCLKFDI